MIESNLGVDAISADLQSSESGQATIPLVDTLKLSIVDIGQHNHLGGLYHTENNVHIALCHRIKKWWPTFILIVLML